MRSRRSPDVTDEEVQEAQRQAAEQEAEFVEALADPSKALALLGRHWPKDWGTPEERAAYQHRKSSRAAKRRCDELLREARAKRKALDNAGHV